MTDQPSVPPIQTWTEYTCGCGMYRDTGPMVEHIEYYYCDEHKSATDSINAEITALEREHTPKIDKLRLLRQKIHQSLQRKS